MCQIQSSQQHHHRWRVWRISCVPGSLEWRWTDHLGLSENWEYSQWNSHLIGIMISKTIGFRGTNHFQTHPFAECCWMLFLGYSLVVPSPRISQNQPRPSIRTWLKHLKSLEEATVQRPWWPAGRIGQGHISRRNSLAASRVTPSTRMWPLRPGCYGFVAKMGDENRDEKPLFNGHLKSWDTEFET